MLLTASRPVKVNPVRVESDEEKRLFALGEKNYNAKKALAKTTLRKQTPNDQESDLIHAMWLRQLEYRGQSSWNLNTDTITPSISI